MKVKFIVVLLTMLGVASAKADDYKQDLNNYSHQSIICATYYTITAQCLLNRDKNDPLAARLQGLANTSIDESYRTGKIAGISEKALTARSLIEAEGQTNDIEGSCGNISVLNLKHGRRCKAFMESREQQLGLILRKMQKPSQ